MLAPPLADFLQTYRTSCNARFDAARRLWPRLDAGDFSLFLRDQLSPLAASLENRDMAMVLNQAYELGLQLVAEKLAGPSAARPEINALWTTVFPSISTHISSAPHRVMRSLINAAHHIAVTPVTRAEMWRNRLVALAPQCADQDQLLVVAQVLAWRAGLSHYRVAALAAAGSLPPVLALKTLDAPADANWPDVRDLHLSDPWFGYHPPDRLNRRIGSFRGFGGLFLTPPLVTRSGSHILVHSGDDSWILVADAFGATFHRASPQEIQVAARVSASSGGSRLPVGHRATSCVVLDKTYAVTSAQSHSIWTGPVLSEL
ncbi:MAG: hypothetical protein MUF20_10125 [Methylotetracoccus sp.]|nr:hypothetical protein [Methylotetracoccus sp.]